MDDNKLKWFWDSFDAYLSSNNLKQSKQRNEITQVFLMLPGHVSAEQLHQAAKLKGLSAGLATIYRTLNLLTEANLIEQHSFADGTAIYEVKHPDDHHDHLICEDCGKVFEFEEESIEKLQLEIAKKLGFNLSSHRLDLFGQCIKKNCPEKSST